MKAPRLFTKKYGYGWQDIRDKRRTRRLDREEEQRIAVGQIAVAKLIDAPINDLTKSVTGLCRSADDGSRTEELNGDDAARDSSEPKPRPTDGSFPKAVETNNGRASMVLPELVPPMMRIHIAERTRIRNARTNERREFFHEAAIEYEEMVKNAHRSCETFRQLPEGSSPPACLENSSAGMIG